MVGLKQTLLKVKSKTTVDVKYSRKEHSARVSSLLRVYEQYERQLEGQVREATKRRKATYSYPHRMGVLQELEAFSMSTRTTRSLFAVWTMNGVCVVSE